MLQWVFISLEDGFYSIDGLADRTSVSDTMQTINIGETYAFWTTATTFVR